MVCISKVIYFLVFVAVMATKTMAWDLEQDEENTMDMAEKNFVRRKFVEQAFGKRACAANGDTCTTNADCCNTDDPSGSGRCYTTAGYYHHRCRGRCTSGSYSSCGVHGCTYSSFRGCLKN